MRLNDASIAKIENVDPGLQVKYLSNKVSAWTKQCNDKKGKRTIENFMEGRENEPS